MTVTETNQWYIDGPVLNLQWRPLRYVVPIIFLARVTAERSDSALPFLHRLRKSQIVEFKMAICGSLPTANITIRDSQAESCGPPVIVRPGWGESVTFSPLCVDWS